MASPQLLVSQRSFMEKLGKELGFKEMKDWYRLTRGDVKKHGGGRLLSGSPPQLVRSLFPDHHWENYRFGAAPKGHWNSEENARVFMTWLGKELGYNEMKNWYKITQEDVKKNGGTGLLGKYSGSPSM